MMICERLKAVKEAKNMTNQQLADLSDVPIGTVNRILSLSTDNPGINTILALATALEISLDELVEAPVPPPVELDALTVAYEKQLEEKDKRIADKDKRIEDKDIELRYRGKWIKILFASFLVVIAFLIAWLIIDIVNPAVGWIRR